MISSDSHQTHLKNDSIDAEFRQIATHPVFDHQKDKILLQSKLKTLNSYIRHSRTRKNLVMGFENCSDNKNVMKIFPQCRGCVLFFFSRLHLCSQMDYHSHAWLLSEVTKQKFLIDGHQLSSKWF